MVNLILDMIDCEPEIPSNKYFYEGKCVPRVTEILGIINDEYLIQWANSMGFKHKSYESILNQAAAIGTIVHDLCDRIMRDLPVDLTCFDRSISTNIFNCVTAFKSWWANLTTQYNVEIVFIEQELVCEYFGGTCDVLLKINGRYYLGDFKTSNHIGYKYYMQLAAYRYILKEKMDIELDGAFILQLSKTSCIYKDYVMNFGIPVHLQFIEDCFNCMTGAVFLYYNKLNLVQNLLENQNELTKGGYLECQN